jgi:hypothetical protein
LLDPKIERQLPDDELPMPTDVEIIRSTSKDSEPDSPEDPEDEEEDTTELIRVPMSMAQISQAIDNIIYSLNRQPHDPDGPDWSLHIKNIHSVLDDISHVRFSSLKQKSLTDFFNLDPTDRT